MLVVVLWLNGGLYHVMRLFLLRLLSVVWGLVSLCAGLYSSLWLYPLFLSASWYGLVAWLNMFLFNEIADNLWLMFSGMVLILYIYIYIYILYCLYMGVYYTSVKRTQQFVYIYIYIYI